MWEAIGQSGGLIMGVLALFALFMAALFVMEREQRKRQPDKRHPRPALRVIRCEKRDRAA